MIRLFISIEIPKRIRDDIYKASLEFGKTVEGKFVDSDNIHITMKFLGWVDESKLDGLKKALSKIKFNSFDCELKGVGAFPTQTSPRVLWVGFTNEELTKLATDIEDMLFKLGFEKEGRPFHNHATFCRVKSSTKSTTKKLFEKYEIKSFGKFKVKEFHLMESKLKKSGPIYSSLGVFKAL